jgi:acyl-CoA thioesterase I
LKAKTMRLFLFFALMAMISAPALAQTKRIVALGDSLTAGYGLQAGEDFASKLQESLIKEGLDVKIDNAGVSGDTTAGGLARIDWAIEGDQKPDLVLVALGANDMLRGIDPAVTKDNLSKILTKLKEKEIPAFLIGMRSPTNMGQFFRGKFDKVYKELAGEYGVPLYPFFLDGVAMKADLNLEDGMHPNAKGVDMIVQKITPAIKKTLK